jgi:heparanase 1
MVRFWKTIVTGVALAMAVMAHLTQAQDRTSVMLAPATMKPVGTIGDRHQSYNVEMLEVTGGKFWKPYKEIGNPVPQPSAAADGKAQSGDTPAGMSADLYQYRPPIDLTNPRLRAMARALGPAYMRISGTWANTT